MAAKKKTRKSSDKPMTKAGFIRSMGPDVAPAEVIAKAKEQGIELTKKLVWTTQSEMRTGGKSNGKARKTKGSAMTVAIKPDDGATAANGAGLAPTAPATRKKPGPKKGFRKAAAKATKAAAAPAKAAAAPAKVTNGVTAEQKLKALVIELGTARAEEIYRAVRTQLSAIVGQA